MAGGATLAWAEYGFRRRTVFDGKNLGFTREPIGEEEGFNALEKTAGPVGLEKLNTKTAGVFHQRKRKKKENKIRQKRPWVLLLAEPVKRTDTPLI